MAAPAQPSIMRDEERRVREAWARYREDVRELEGREYEDAEDDAWSRLQRRLAEIQRQFSPSSAKVPRGRCRSAWVGGMRERPRIRVRNASAAVGAVVL